MGVKQREVLHEGVRWQCVQAFSGVNANQNNQEVVRNKDGFVTVVCTPSGGEQSVRLELSPD